MSTLYPYFDFHCDTLSKAYNDKTSLNHSDYMVNINSLKKYSPSVQTFAIYNDGSMYRAHMTEVFSFFKNQCRTYSEMLAHACTSADIKNNEHSGRMSALLAIEGLGNQVDFDINTVAYYYEQGVRIIGLCHNDDNILCGGCGKNHTGLTPLGRSVLRQMQKLGIILDVSHMSDIGFWQSAEEYSLPFAATHSNSRSVCPHNRNLTDEQFICLAKRGGLCGINLYPPFTDGDTADIDDIIRHIEHFVSLGGENSICIGSDFDGIPYPVSDIDNAGDMYKLFDTLLSHNYNETLINKLAFNNFHNFLKKFEALA